MNFRVKFTEQGGSFRAKFGAVQTASDGGFERGYAAGYEKGKATGRAEGYADGRESGYADGYEAGLMEGHEDACLDGTLTGEYVNDRVTSIRQYALYQQYSLESVRMNKVASVPVYGFGHCPSLKYAEFASATSIAAAAFLMCYSLTALVLRCERIVSLANVNAFSSCYHFSGDQNATYNPNGDADGYIYVPDNLVEQYKTATNWSTYATQIKPLSELPND